MLLRRSGDWSQARAYQVATLARNTERSGAQPAAFWCAGPGVPESDSTRSSGGTAQRGGSHEGGPRHTLHGRPRDTHRPPPARSGWPRPAGVRPAPSTAEVASTVATGACLMTRYGQYCPITRALEVLGERWSLLIVRDLLVGVSRFNELSRGLPRLGGTSGFPRRRAGRSDAGDRHSGAGPFPAPGPATQPRGAVRTASPGLSRGVRTANDDHATGGGSNSGPAASCLFLAHRIHGLIVDHGE